MVWGGGSMEMAPAACPSPKLPQHLPKHISDWWRREIINSLGNVIVVPHMGGFSDSGETFGIKDDGCNYKY